MTEAEWIAFLQRPEIPAFNRAMLVNPDDDLPRLVFADWMDENCPDTAVNAAVRGSIMNEHKQIVWPAQREVRAFQLDCVRGRVRLMMKSQLRPTSARISRTLWEAVWRAGWVDSLLLGDCRYDVLFGWFNDAPMEGVTEIGLDCDQVFGDQLRTLLSSARLTHLSSLGLSGWQLPADFVGTLANAEVVSRLRSLSINCSNLRGDSLVSLLITAPLQRLEDLCIIGARLGDRIAGFLANHPSLANLKWMVFHDHAMTSTGAAALANSPYLCEAIRAQFRRPTDEGGA